jgi:phospholipid-translocating ATPase
MNRFLFWRQAKTPELPRMRTVIPNHVVPPGTKQRDHPNRAYTDNAIRTSKYTPLSFIPKNLLEQFHRFANLYFLFIVLLNWIPAVSAFGKEVAMIPVIFVLGVTAIKDAFEDHRRRQVKKKYQRPFCGFPINLKLIFLIFFPLSRTSESITLLAVCIEPKRTDTCASFSLK